MRTIILIISIALSINSIAQSKKNNVTNKWVYEILDEFIKQDKESGGIFPLYSVYVLSVYKSQDDDSNDTCYTIGLIQNESFFDIVMPEYYSHYYDELVVFVFNSSIQVYNEKGFDLKSIDHNNDSIVLNRLLSKEKGFFTGTTPGILIRKKSDVLFITEYENSDDIPENKSIFNFLDLGETELLNEGNIEK